MKQSTVTKNQVTKLTDAQKRVRVRMLRVAGKYWSDFPSNIQHALDGGLPQLLCIKARHIGVHFEALIAQILSLHAYMNMRRAQGLVTLATNYPHDIVETAAARALTLRAPIAYKPFKLILKALMRDQSVPR